MQRQELPSEVGELLKQVEAPPRLIAHLQLVYNTACALVWQFDHVWPELVYDREALCIGAAIHDIGKICCPEELMDEGNEHEAVGEQWLLERGWPERYARFARTHGQWQTEETAGLEDLLVALADKLWKGKRVGELEMVVAKKLSGFTSEEAWEAYLKLDEIASELSKDAHERIVWQGGQKI